MGTSRNTLKAVEDFLIVKSDWPEKVELAILFGGSDLKLSSAAARLFKKGYYQRIIVSGGRNEKIGETEAEHHRNNLIRKGVSKENILLEPSASNTLENVVFSKKIIAKYYKSIPQKILVIGKAFHGRRMLMTLRKNLSKQTEYILVLVQTKDHTVRNRYKGQGSREHVFDELRKIGEYTLKDYLGWG